MIPATIPGIPFTLFPGLLMPSLPVGVTVVDVTAAVAVLAWAFAGLVALRIAIRMSRRDDAPGRPHETTTPTHPHGFRDAA